MSYFTLKQNYANNELKGCLALVLSTPTDSTKSYNEWVAEAKKFLSQVPEIKEYAKEKPDPLFGNRWKLSDIVYSTGRTKLTDDEVIKLFKIGEVEKSLLDKFKIDFIHLYEGKKLRVLKHP